MAKAEGLASDKSIRRYNLKGCVEEKHLGYEADGEFGRATELYLSSV